GTFPSPLPSLSPLPPHCLGETCAMSGSATMTLLGRDPPETEPCDSDAACAANEEANPYVREGRVIARIAVDVRASDGTLLATRENDVTVRTFAGPPYLAMAGAIDRTVDARAVARGEDAGLVPRTPNPCAAGPAGESSDTVVRVAYEDAETGTCSDGSSWRTT